MLLYQLRLAWKSLRRNPVLSILMVAGIGLGMGVAMTFVTAHYHISGDPLPHKSDRLFYVQMDSWDPSEPFNEEPDNLPHQLTYMDAVGILDSEIPTYRSAMYKTYLTVHPEGEQERPFREVVRMCHADFFSLFDVPFRYGSGWTRDTDENAESVIVLGDEMNKQLFGGENSVGRTLRIEEREFKVAGVLEPWRPVPKYYDPHNGPFDDAEEIYMPFSIGILEEWNTAGNTWSWKESGNTFQDKIRSEAVWIQYWVQLDDAEQRERYMAFLDGYVAEQKKLGRFERPTYNVTRGLMAWLHYWEVVPEEANIMLINALLFLLICSVNLIGILLGKFLGRAPEIGVRRALGASKRWVFVQHLVECELIGLLGGVLGLVLSLLGLEVINVLFNAQFDFGLDPNLFAIATGLALASAMIAGIYPAWRICRIEPGRHLKAQ
jgi:putative ABC transport system permease protein